VRAKELVALQPDVILANSTPVTAALQRETRTIPIVFTGVTADPIGEGFVTSLARPGGNVTGLSTQHADAAGKRIELLHEVICPCSKNELSDTPVPAATS
jgi:putative tryptophan/tyrosine transport system substrate-binding protein